MTPMPAPFCTARRIAIILLKVRFDARGDFGWRLATVSDMRAYLVELDAHVLRGAEQQFTLLGQDQATRMPMEERCLELLFERADLPADGRLAEVENLPRMGEGTGIGRGLKHAQ